MIDFTYPLIPDDGWTGHESDSGDEVYSARDAMAGAIASTLGERESAEYNYTIDLLNEMLGVSEADLHADYTYYDLPAVGASPNNFEGFE